MRIDYQILRTNGPAVVVTVLFALFMITLPRFTEFSRTWYALLLLAGLICMVFDFRRIRKIAAAERVFFSILLLNFAWIAFSSYYNGQAGKGSAFLWDRHFYMLLTIPMFFLFRRIGIHDKAVLLILFSSVSISLGDILLEYLRNIDYREVLHDRTNINGFAPIQLCLSGMLLLYFIYSSKRGFRWLALVGSACGIVAVILSESRSA